MEITEQSLNALREAVGKTLSPKRLVHTLAVEEMIARLCALYCPERTSLLRAAALLHDITKENTTARQIELCNRYGIPVTETDLLSPKTFHAKTAEAVIRTEFSEFADPILMRAVRYHTTGRANMTMEERLLYFADYIDASRTFEQCVLLRRYFWDAEPERMGREERETLLRDAMIRSLHMTMRDLIEENSPIDTDTVEALNSLLLERALANRQNR